MFLLGDDLLEVLHSYNLSRWIWHGDGFVGIDEMTLERSAFAGRNVSTKRKLDLEPYVYTVCIVKYFTNQHCTYMVFIAKKKNNLITSVLYLNFPQFFLATKASHILGQKSHMRLV